MKKIVIIATLLVFLGISSLAFAQSAPDVDAVKLKVDGLGCPYCSIGFIKQVRKLGKLKDIDSSYEEGIFTFNIDPKYKISLEGLKKATQKAGYTLVYAKISYQDGKVDEFGKLKE